MLLPLILWLLVLRFVIFLVFLVLYCYETRLLGMFGKNEEEPVAVVKEVDPEAKYMDNIN